MFYMKSILGKYNLASRNSFLCLVAVCLSIFTLPAQNLTDVLRQETRLNQVYQQHGLSGQGVILAMIERGIDYRHPDFIDASGKTRIAYIFDMTDPSGANDPNNTYGVGTIYSRSQIDQALTSGNVLATMDRYGHGTACTGIAAGDGSAVTGSPYPGVAPGATIISVKLINDPFPAGSGQPAQAWFYEQSYLPIALQFVKDKSTELGLPSVSLMNLGSIGGPTDGTSDICRAMDGFVGPGRLLVCGVGDDGGADNHAEMTLTQGNSDEFEISKGEAGNLRFEAWYDGNDRFDVTIIRPNGSQEGPFAGPAANNAIAWQQLTGISIYHNGADRDFSSSTNGKRQLMIDFTGATGTYKVKLSATAVSNGKIDASLNPSTYYNNNAFSSHIVAGFSINDFASATQALVPTDYVHSNSYKDINGAARSRNEGAPGELWTGSSSGPTLDGRLGVDIAVPGELNVGAYSAGTYYSRFSHLLVEGGNSLYGIQNAVSGAAPVLTGMLALMLEVKPDLSTQEARDILHQTARSDAFTGMTPTPDWGYGKLDAAAAITATLSLLGMENETFASLGIQLFPNPAQEIVYYRWDRLSHGEAELELMDMSGRSLRRYMIGENAGQLHVGEFEAGVYLLRLKTEDQIAWMRLVLK